MSSKPIFDVNKYREEHEIDEQWELRRQFIEKYKDSYPEDRLICLSKLMINVEFLGAKYSKPVMDEISTLSEEIVQPYREKKKNKLRRTFVSASSVARDRVTATKRSNVDEPRTSKTSKIEFVRASTDWVPECLPVRPSEFVPKSTNARKSRNIPETYIPKRSNEEKDSEGESNTNKPQKEEEKAPEVKVEVSKISKPDQIDFVSDLEQMQCLEMSQFNDSMFYTEYGRLVLLIRPWEDFLWNMQATGQATNLSVITKPEDQGYVLKINHRLVARIDNCTKTTGRLKVARKAWDILRNKVICLLIKEKYVGEENWRVNTSDVCQGTSTEVGYDTPVRNDVALKMMRMMGWKGGGLGSNSQGISEPIKPNIHVVNRAGFGSNINDEHNLKRSAMMYMRDYRVSGPVGVDLVFSSDFSKNERAVLHNCARKSGLKSRSFGDKGSDRFLVVRRKHDWFSTVKQVIAEGGKNMKFQVFIPATLMKYVYSDPSQSSRDVPGTSRRPMVTTTVTSNFLESSSEDSSDDD